MRSAVRVPASLAGLIGGLHPQIKRKLRASLEALAHEPRSGKPLKRELAGLWSMRIGKFRLIYRIARSRRLELVAFGPREQIYEETLRLIKSRGGERVPAKDA
jgi:mRNA interferase RelE/StbE